MGCQVKSDETTEVYFSLLCMFLLVQRRKLEDGKLHFHKQCIEPQSDLKPNRKSTKKCKNLKHIRVKNQRDSCSKILKVKWESVRRTHIWKFIRNFTAKSINIITCTNDLESDNRLSF